ncbi:MAG: hypothetical protein EDM79_13950, partial [Chloroflexi bacterium]
AGRKQDRHQNDRDNKLWICFHVELLLYLDECFSCIQIRDGRWNENDKTADLIRRFVFCAE